MSWTALGLFPLRTLGSSEMKRFICPSASLRTLFQSWTEPGAHSAGRATVGFSAVGNSEGTGPDGSEEGMPVADLASLTGGYLDSFYARRSSARWWDQPRLRLQAMPSCAARGASATTRAGRETGAGTRQT